MYKNINIMFALNDDYGSKLAVALTSLLKNNLEICSRFKIYIRSLDLTNESKKEFLRISKKYGCNNVFFLDANECEETISSAVLPAFKGNHIAYYKIFNLEQVTDDDRLLVLDCDLLINSGIDDLYEYDLGNKIVGAVKNPPSTACFHINKEYNTGVMLINMKRYKEKNVTQYLVNFAREIPLSDWKAGDQTLISLGLEAIDKICLLPMRYNVILNETCFTAAEFNKVYHTGGGMVFGKRI